MNQFFLYVTFLCSTAFVATALTAEFPQVEIIAHRGASHDAPENSIAALKLGFEQASDAGELDVWVSKDGYPVVIHDADTKRVAGVNRRVADQTLSEIRDLDIGTWMNVRFAGMKIPTLAESLAIVPAGKRMFVEIKCGPDKVPAILADIRRSELLPGQTPVISFDADVVAAVKNQRPDLQAYWLVSLKDDKRPVPAVEELIVRTKKIQADGLDVSDSPLLDAAFVAKVRAADLKLYVWTVDAPAAARRLVDIGVDGITTNRPGWLREQLELR